MRLHKLKILDERKRFYPSASVTQSVRTANFVPGTSCHDFFIQARLEFWSPSPLMSTRGACSITGRWISSVPLFRFVSKFFRVPVLRAVYGSSASIEWYRWYSRGVRRVRSVAYLRSGAPTTTVSGSTTVVADRAPARLDRPQVGVQRYRGYVRAGGILRGAPTYLLTASTGALPTSHLTAPTDNLRRRVYLLVKDELR